MVAKDVKCDISHQQLHLEHVMQGAGDGWVHCIGGKRIMKVKHCHRRWQVTLLKRDLCFDVKQGKHGAGS